MRWPRRRVQFSSLRRDSPCQSQGNVQPGRVSSLVMRGKLESCLKQNPHLSIGGAALIATFGTVLDAHASDGTHSAPGHAQGRPISFLVPQKIRSGASWKRSPSLGYDRFGHHHLVWGEANKVYYLKDLEASPKTSSMSWFAKRMNTWSTTVWPTKMDPVVILCPAAVSCMAMSIIVLPS